MTDIFGEFNESYYQQQEKERKESAMKKPDLLDDVRWLEDPRSDSMRAKMAIDAHIAMTRAGFNNWAYLTSVGKMVNINTGEIISKDAFSDLLGHLSLPLCVGYRKTEDGDTEPAIKMAKSAAMSFTSNKFFLWNKVFGVCIDAEVEHGGNVDIEGKSHVNLWSGTVIKPKDHGGKYFERFVDLATRVMEKDDAAVVIEWMAHKVQNPTKKINWSPILVGTKGNGKTTLAAIVANIIGSRYSRVINKESLKEKFNGWIENSCFVVVEEIKVGADFDVINRLKEYVANETISMRKMQMDSYSIVNHADFIFCSNHIDAIKIENDERRWFPVMTKQRCADDVTASFGSQGGAEYFNKMYKEVVKNKDALEDICYHLCQMDLTQFNKGRAPDSKHKSEFLEASLSNDAFEIKETIELCELEVNGVIFTQDVTKHLNNRGVKISSRRYGQALAELGYERMPNRIRIGGGNGYIYTHSKRFNEGSDAVYTYKAGIGQDDSL